MGVNSRKIDGARNFQSANSLELTHRGCTEGRGVRKIRISKCEFRNFTVRPRGHGVPREFRWESDISSLFRAYILKSFTPGNDRSRVPAKVFRIAVSLDLSQSRANTT